MTRTKLFSWSLRNPQPKPSCIRGRVRASPCVSKGYVQAVEEIAPRVKDDSVWRQESAGCGSFSAPKVADTPHRNHFIRNCRKLMMDLWWWICPEAAGRLPRSQLKGRGSVWRLTLVWTGLSGSNTDYRKQRCQGSQLHGISLVGSHDTGTFKQLLSFPKMLSKPGE